MILNAKDCIIVGTLLSGRGNFVGLALQKEIAEKVVLTAGEREAAGIVAEKDLIRWDDEGATKIKKEVKFSAAELEFLGRIIKERNDKEEVDLGQVETFLKIRAANENVAEKKVESPEEKK